MRSLLTLGLLALVAAPAAAQDPDKKNVVQPVEVIKLDRTDPVSYEKEIYPIFKNRCFVCHTGQELGGQVGMSNYESLNKGGKRGQPITPGRSQDSLLVKLAGRTQKPYMPPRDEGDPMTPKELALVKLWIDQGA